MPNSQNGYSVIERDDCRFYDDIVDGLSLPLRDDACGVVLAYFLRGYNAKVERLGRTETFGHSKRAIAGSDEWSNHASATAVDANASQHPHGKVGTYTSDELRALRTLLENFDEVIKWGGDFRTTKDEMHYEIDKPYAEVKLLSRVLRRDGRINLDRLEPGNRNLDVYMVKRALKNRGLFSGTMNNYFGKGLQSAYAAWQRHLGYDGDAADGIPGPASLRELNFTVKEG